MKEDLCSSGHFGIQNLTSMMLRNLLLSGCIKMYQYLVKMVGGHW